MAWTNLDAWSVPLRAPFVVDVTEPTFRLVEFILIEEIIYTYFYDVIMFYSLSYLSMCTHLVPSSWLSLSLTAWKVQLSPSLDVTEPTFRLAEFILIEEIIYTYFHAVILFYFFYIFSFVPPVCPPSRSLYLLLLGKFNYRLPP